MPTVLITGCSTGFGKLAVETFQRAGWNVAATMRSPEKDTELKSLDHVAVIQLDVTQPKSIKSAVDTTLAQFGSIEVLVNNAGYGSNALFEQSPDVLVRDIYETNVFGVMNVVREVLPHMRKQKSGRIINITSMAGLMGLAGNSIYSSAKFAVEGLTEALAVELKPLNIQVKSIAPGAYSTTAFLENVDSRVAAGDPDVQAYSQKLRDHFANTIAGRGEPQDPQEVADLMLACATEDLPVHNVAGADAQMLIGQMPAPGDRQQFIAAMEAMLLPKD